MYKFNRTTTAHRTKLERKSPNTILVIAKRSYNLHQVWASPKSARTSAQFTPPPKQQAFKIFLPGKKSKVTLYTNGMWTLSQCLSRGEGLCTAGWDFSMAMPASHPPHPYYTGISELSADTRENVPVGRQACSAAERVCPANSLSPHPRPGQQCGRHWSMRWELFCDQLILRAGWVGPL